MKEVSIRFNDDCRFTAILAGVIKNCLIVEKSSILTIVVREHAS